MDIELPGRIDLLTVHDSEVLAVVLSEGEASIQLGEVTAYTRRADGLFDELRCSGELRVCGVEEFVSKGQWVGEFVLSGSIDGRDIYEHGAGVSSGIAARSVSLEFMDAQVAITCDGLVRFKPTGDVAVRRRGVDPFAQD